MSIKVTNEKKEVFKIKPFKHIHIGDPLYFEELAAGSTNKALKEMTLDAKMRCCNFGAVVVNKNFVESEEFSYHSIDVGIYLASSEKMLDVYLDGKWYGEKTVKEEHELGCDTASFEMVVDGRYNFFRTGADGYYGNAKLMKQYYGFRCSLSFDASLFEFDEIIAEMKSLFEEKG